MDILRRMDALIFTNTSEIQRLEVEVSSMRGDIQHFYARFAENRREIARLNNAIDQLTDTIDKLNNAFTQFNNERDTIDQRLILIEEFMDKYRPLIEVVTPEDLVILEKLHNEIKGLQPRSAVPKRTAFALLASSRLYDLDLHFLTAVAHFESRFMPNAVSSANARGLMQLTNLIWRNYRNLFPWDIEVCVFDELTNTLVAARFLSDLNKKYANNATRVLQHYNGGPSAASRGVAVRYADGVLRKSAQLATSWNLY